MKVLAKEYSNSFVDYVMSILSSFPFYFVYPPILGELLD